MSNGFYSESLYISEADVDAVIVPHRTTPGFVIPLARPHVLSNASYTPTVDHNGLIDGFTPILESGVVRALDKSHIVKVGDKEVFAIVDPYGNPHVGTRQALGPIVNRWIEAVEPAVCRLNFAVFTKNMNIINQTLNHVISQKEDELGNTADAHRWFITTFVSTQIIKIFGRNQKSANSSFKGLFDYGVPQIKIVGPTQATIFIPIEIFKSDERTKRRYRNELKFSLELARIATGLSISVKPQSTHEEPRSHNRMDPIGNPPNEIEWIKGFSNQEKRVAALAALYITDRDTAESVYSVYVDRAEYANRALGLLRRLLVDAGGSATRPERVAALIPDLVNLAYPKQKGRLLLELARALGTYVEVGNRILRISRRSRQREIKDVSDQLEHFVQGAANDQE